MVLVHEHSLFLIRVVTSLTMIASYHLSTVPDEIQTIPRPHLSDIDINNRHTQGPHMISISTAEVYLEACHLGVKAVLPGECSGHAGGLPWRWRLDPRQQGPDEI